MTDDVLMSLGALTLGGAIAIAFFALTARISRSRYAARWRCLIWLLLCLRLIIPFSFLTLIETEKKAPIQIEMPADVVVYEYMPYQSEPVFPESTPAGQNEPPPAATGGNETTVLPMPTPNSALKPPKETTITISLLEIILIVWLSGAIAMTIWIIVSHLRFLRYLRRWSRRVEDADLIRLYNGLGDQLGLDQRPGLNTCSGLQAPMLAGLFRPTLLLPEGDHAGGIKYVLVHELLHFKRRDIWLKALALLANIVHWFNPFMWYMVHLVERDTELACDEAALRHLPLEEHGEYGRTILNEVERLKKSNKH